MRKLLALALVLGLTSAAVAGITIGPLSTGGGVIPPPSGYTPVVTPATCNVSPTFAVNGEVQQIAGAGTCAFTATCNNTTCTGANAIISWAITAQSNPSVFAINAIGGLLGGPSAANVVTPAANTVTVAATNATGQSVGVAQTVNTVTCGQGTVYADGCASAPTGIVQQATLLNSYPTRTPWNAAGIDYHVGQASNITVYGSTSVNPTQAQLNLGSTGATISGSTVTLSGANPSLGTASIGYTFANNTVVVVSNTASGTAKVTNCVITMSGQGGIGVDVANGYTVGLTVTNTEINGSQYGSSSTQSFDTAIYYGGNGAFVSHYNYLHGLPVDAHQVQAGTSTYDIRYNLVYGLGYSPGTSGGGHPDFLQVVAGTTNGTAAFNTYHNPPGSGKSTNPAMMMESQLGETACPCFYANNIIISGGSTVAPTNALSFGSFISDTTSTIHGMSFIFNYIDPTGDLFYPPYYYGSPSQLVVTTGSINLHEGNRLLTTGALNNATSVGYVPLNSTTAATGAALATDIVSAAASPATGTIITGSSIVFTLTAARPLTIPLAAYLTLSNGAHAAYSSGTGTTSLVFSYVVQAGDATANNLAITGFVP